MKEKIIKQSIINSNENEFISIFTKENLLEVYNIGFNTGKSRNKNNGEKIVEAFVRAQELDRNINWV